MIKMTSKTTSRDLGEKAMLKRVDALKDKPHVKVGILESAGQHQNSDLTVAQVATFHEFGTESIPERSFIRTTVDENTEKYHNKIDQLRKDVIFFGKSTRKALTELGLFIQRDIKKTITDTHPSWPQLSDTTIAQRIKNSDKPLIDTGQLRNSVQYEVVEKG